MTMTHTILKRCAAALILVAASLPLVGAPAASARDARRDDAFAFHGTTGATHTVALQGDRYVVDVFAAPNPATTPADGSCSFTASLNGVEHPITGGLSTLGSTIVSTYSAWRWIPTLDLQAGHYTLNVSPLTDCYWTVSIGGGTGHPTFAFGDAGIDHTLARHTVKATVVERNDQSYTFSFAYNAWGEGYAAPTASVAIVTGGRTLHTYALAPGIAADGQTSFDLTRAFHAGRGDAPGRYTARFTARFGGKTFTKATDYTLQDLAPGHWVAQTSGTASDLGDIACTGVSTCISPGRNATIIATTDGRTWSREGTPLDGAGFVTLDGVSCPSARVCYVGGEQCVILGSTDGGRTWSVQNGDRTYTSPGQGFISIGCPSESHCYAVGFGGVIAATTDGGSHWATQQEYASGKDLTDVACPSETTCYAVGAGGTIARTTDGGATWQRRSVGSFELFSVDCPAARRCYAAGQQGTILATTDGGATWTRQSNPLDGSDIWVDSVSCSSTTTCHAVGQLGTLLLTTDGGRTWRDQRSPADQQLNVVACPAAGVCYAVGQNGTLIKGA